MREILFRGKLKSNGKWVYGNLNINQQGVTIITPDETLIGIYGQVIPKTVGQYTGRCGKNGTRIFEGDIVRIDDFMYCDHPNGVITYEAESTQFLIMFGGNKDDIENVGAWAEEIIVIGNIYDNPELIKN